MPRGAQSHFQKKIQKPINQMIGMEEIRRLTQFQSGAQATPSNSTGLRKAQKQREREEKSEQSDQKTYRWDAVRPRMRLRVSMTSFAWRRISSGGNDWCAVVMTTASALRRRLVDHGFPFSRT